MAAAVAASKTNQAAAAASDSSDNAIIPIAKLVDPQLLMAARRGDSKRLKDLLLLKDDDEQQGTSDGSGTALSAATAAAGGQDVIVEVDDPRPPHDDAVAPPPSSGLSSPPVPVVVLDEDGVTMEGDSLLHVVAACGDGEEYLQCAKMIVRDKMRKGGAAAVRLVLEARNHKGDTPLHCAAGAGNANMISCLMDLIANDTKDDEAGAAAVKKAFLRLQNECGKTALHQAVRAVDNKVACIDQLMEVDPELACIPPEDGGASPLYLAISLGEIEIAEHLYVKSKGKLSYSGPDGRNVLHAAVYRGQALPMILAWLAAEDKKPKEEQQQHLMSGKSSRRVSRLTSQRDKNHKGSTPLHLATSLDGWPSAGFLSIQFPQVWPGSQATARLLLNANESMAYQADDEGSYPIHVAAWSDSIDVMKLLLGRCPDCATLRDGKGRTFLHVAAEEGHLALVRYVVCGQMPQRLLSSSMILNAQDSKGDTALHYAVRAGNVAVFNCLLRNPRVRLDVANKDGMTPLDLSCTLHPTEFQYRYNPRSIVLLSLLEAGAPYGGGRPELFTEKHLLKRDLDKESKKHTEATQVMSIITALIATVTFASAFMLPGGYRSDGDAAGTPVLAGSYAFDAFILADTLAFICSISATYFLFYVGVPSVDLSIRFRYFKLSLGLMKSAARSLVAAFGLGLYLVVHHTASAIAACAIVFASSIYGNIDVWRLIIMATTVLARIGIRRYAVVGYAKRIFIDNILVHFWSYLLIFGLPAIRKRLH